MGARGEGQARGRGRDVNAQCPDVSPWPGQSGRQLISLRRSDGCDRLSTVDEIRGEDRLAVIRCVFSSSSSPTSLLSPPHPAAMLIYNQTADKTSLLPPLPHPHCHSHRDTPYNYHHYHHRRRCGNIIFFFVGQVNVSVADITNDKVCLRQESSMSHSVFQPSNQNLIALAFF